MKYAADPATYRHTCHADFTKDNPLWNNIPPLPVRLYLEIDHAEP